MNTEPGDYGLSPTAVYHARRRDLHHAQERADYSYAELQRRTRIWEDAQRARRWMTWRYIVGAVALGVGWLCLPYVAIGVVAIIAVLRIVIGMDNVRCGRTSHHAYFGWRVRGSRAHIAATRWTLDDRARQYEQDAIALNKATIALIAACPGADWPLADLCPNAGIDEYEKAVRTDA